MSYSQKQATSKNLLKDNSWIRKNEEEDEPVDRDPNFGKAVLKRLKSNEFEERFSSQDQTVRSTPPPSYDKAIASKNVTTKVSADGRTTETTETTITTSRTATKKGTTFTDRVFSDVKSQTRPSALPSKPRLSSDTEVTTRTGTRSVSSPRTPDSKSVTSFTEVVKNESSTRTYSSPDSSSVTTTTRTRSVTNPDTLESNTVTTYTETVKDRTRSVSSQKIPDTSPLANYKETMKPQPLDALADDLISLPSSPFSPSDRRTYSSSSPGSTKTITTRTSTSDTLHDKSLEALSDDLLSSSSPRDRSADYSRTYSSSSPDSSITTTTTRTRSVSSPKPSETTTVTTYTETRRDDDYRSYSPTPDSGSISSTRTIKTYSSNDYSPTVRTSSYSVSSDPSLSDGLYKSKSYSSLPRSSTSYEYTNVSSPSYTKSSYLENSPSGSCSNIRSSSSDNLYSSTERAITPRDICTYCRKPMSIEPKMILDDLQIHCHATCFKCEVCNNSLGHLQAGDTMWIYKRTVHCERCFENTREKWQR